MFEHSNYKVIVRKSLLEKKNNVSRQFTFESLANQCRVQKTYLSRVLNSDHGHLSDDQLYRAGMFLGWTDEERDYVGLLRKLDRTCVPERKQELTRRIGALQKEHQESGSRLVARDISSGSDVSEYYLDPLIMLVHLFLAIPGYRRDLPRIAQALRIDQNHLVAILSQLERMKMIQLDDQGHYQILNEQNHLPASSPLYRPFRFMQRMKSLERMQVLDKDRTYNFSAAFTANEATRKHIRERFLAFLGEIEKVANAADDEAVFQINFDLFDWIE